MTNIKNKNKFLKFSSIFLIGVFAVFLAFMPFMMNKNKDKVMADSVETESYTFTSSTIVLPVNLCDSSGSLTSNQSYITPLNLLFTINSSGLYLYNGSSRSIVSAGNGDWSAYVSSSFVYNFSYGWNSVVVPIGSRYFFFYLKVPSNFNFNVIRIDISNKSTNDFGGRYKGTSLDLVDSDNNSLFMQFPLVDSLYNSSISLLYRVPRSYYLLDTSQLTDNQFYNQGKDDGLALGRAEGDSEGYQRGLDEGFSNGEQYGYNQGLIAGADVSFLNLVGATIDAPVQAFNGLFDFNIDLGGSSFNLKNFLIALLTIALIIAFVRLIMAK